MLAEYIWVDGSEPYRLLRSKTRVFDERPEKFPLWNFDGSSTNQAKGNSSDCVLQPVFTCNDPLRYDSVLVMCEVLTPDMKPHPSNTRSFFLHTGLRMRASASAAAASESDASACGWPAGATATTRT